MPDPSSRQMQMGLNVYHGQVLNHIAHHKLYYEVIERQTCSEMWSYRPWPEPFSDKGVEREAEGQRIPTIISAMMPRKTDVATSLLKDADRVNFSSRGREAL